MLVAIRNECLSDDGLYGKSSIEDYRGRKNGSIGDNLLLKTHSTGCDVAVCVFVRFQ
jgi:hypothetical protein